MFELHQTFHENYVEFFTYFNGNEDYFECHEVFEELWKEVAPGHKEHVLVGFILIATGLYHWRRGNMAGATRSIEKGIRIVEVAEPCEYTAYLDLTQFLTKSKEAFAAIQKGQPFQPFKIILTNERLAQLVAEQIASLPATDPHFIQHKHTLRDRSDVIAERAKQLALKQRSL